MEYVLDMHTHTLASGHAYSTIREMTAMAKQKGLKLLGITEHAPKMPGSCHDFYFQNYRVLDRNAYDIPVLFGAEVNLIDPDGSIDLSDELLAQMDIAIISIHPPCVRRMTEDEATKALIKVMHNPDIHIVGHPDDGRFPLNYDELVKAAKETNTLLEVNNSSLSPMSYRPNARENYKKMLDYCVKYDAEIILNSDAHVDTSIANRQYSMPLIEELQFPERLIVNTDVNKLTKRLSCAKINMLKL